MSQVFFLLPIETRDALATGVTEVNLVPMRKGGLFPLSRVPGKTARRPQTWLQLFQSPWDQDTNCGQGNLSIQSI
jgi:hypothetical protein